MNGQEALIIREDESPVLSAPELRHRVKTIQQVMRDVMQEDVHFGKIPGTQRPSLWQPGAEILRLTFGISARFEPVEERITDEEVFYRVRGTATSNSGRELGSLEAVCSTREKKYRWRRPVHLKEFEATPEHLRRVTWDKDGNEVLQVRTDPGDLVHTILMMATKRADVALTRKVCACSDMFEQEVEEDDPKPIVRPVPATPDTAAPLAADTEDRPGPPVVKIVKASKIKSGTSDRGDWILYGVKTSDGMQYTTFDTKIFAACAKAQLENVNVQISSEPVEGKDPRILEVVRA